MVEDAQKQGLATSTPLGAYMRERERERESERETERERDPATYIRIVYKSTSEILLKEHGHHTNGESIFLLQKPLPTYRSLEKEGLRTSSCSIHTNLHPPPLITNQENVLQPDLKETFFFSITILSIQMTLASDMLT